MGNLKKVLSDDLYRLIGVHKGWIGFFLYLMKPEFRFLFFLRLTNNFYLNKNRVRLTLSNFFLKHYTISYVYEIPYQAKIGNGLKLMHFGAIAVNPLVIIGKNVTISKGVTLGSNRRGKNKGAPKIGNGVFIGSNAAIIGNCSIGDNSFIVPNSYVNFDVPANSIVIGNPAKILKSEDATSNYRDNFIK